MAGSGVNSAGASFKSTINGFRRHFSRMPSSIELPAVSLVSNHDETIRFTNSTTSVMKSLLLGHSELEADRTFLVQPAMGSQGIIAWTKRQHLGRYASYFHSMGAIYPTEMGLEACTEMTQIASKWEFDEEDLYFKVSQRDNDLVSLVDNLGIRYEIDDSADTSVFSHTYGSKHLSGRNANLYLSGNANTLGSLTLIERDDIAAAFEVSFDSTPVVARLNGLEHPIDAYPIHDMGVDDIELNRVAVDCAMISGVLALEGLVPSSKGKNGTLRKFFRTYVELVSPYQHRDEIVRQLEAVSEDEAALRQHCLKGDFDYSSLMLDTETIAFWVDQFALNY